MLGIATSAVSLVRFEKTARVTVALDGQIVTFADLSFVIAGIWIASPYF